MDWTLAIPGVVALVVLALLPRMVFGPKFPTLKAERHPDDWTLEHGRY